MFLIRCNQILCRKSGNLQNLFKHSVVYYSDEKNSSDDGGSKPSDKDGASKQKIVKKSVKEEVKAKKSLSPESQNRLNDLLKKLSARSTLGIVRDVQTSKPLGYRNIRKIQKSDVNEARPKNIRDAAKAVSHELGDAKVENDILQPYQTDTNEANFLDDVISTMKTPAKRQNDRQTHRDPAFATDRTQQNEIAFRRRKPQLPQTDAAQSRESRDRKQTGMESLTLDLFGGKPIGIFEQVDQLQLKEDPLKTWNKLEKHELRLRMSMAPRNYFEKMAYWTEEGKIWHFPIDNEQGLDEEMRTPFTHHIFLEEYIESWCPHKGAVHNFMELVCIGLSKNPYLNVQQKREHLDWYRDYFEDKRDILQRMIEEQKSATTQVGDGETKSTTTTTTTATITNS